MIDADRLAAVAVELAVRVRDEPAATNGAWLARKLPDPADRWALCFVLAAAVPIDKPWRQLTAWTTAPPAPVTPIAKPRPGRPKGRAERQPVKPCGTRAAAHRHRYHGERICDPCLEAEREHDRNRKRRRTA